LPSQVKLEPAVITALEKAPREASEILGGVAPFCQILEQPLTKRPVDRPTIVRIDQAQVPQLRALVEVRYAGRGDLDEDRASELRTPKAAIRVWNRVKSARNGADRAGSSTASAKLRTAWS